MTKNAPAEVQATDSNALIDAKIENLKHLQARGVNPFPYRFDVTAHAGELQKKYEALKPGEVTTDKVSVAGRIMAKGYAQGKAKGLLTMDTFPNTGMVMTASLNSIVTDSAPGMQNYVTGNKANNNQEGVFPDDTLDAFDNPRVEYLSEYLHNLQGKSLGVVTTADVFDATPASMAAELMLNGPRMRCSASQMWSGA